MRQLVDQYYHKGLRNRLIESLRERGISNEKVLGAIRDVPRHYFLDSAFDRIAYEDKAFDIGAGQTISQPYAVAFQTHLLDVKPKDKILEIGTGSAYQACVLAQLGAKVFTIERQKELYLNNQQFDFLKQFRLLKMFYGDGFAGLPGYAPFDKIIITAAAPYIPERLVDQLITGGIMVIPLDAENGKQRMMRIIKQVDGCIIKEEFSEFEFVPMLKGKNS